MSHGNRNAMISPGTTAPLTATNRYCLPFNM
jgi:hypothetical protein